MGQRLIEIPNVVKTNSLGVLDTESLLTSYPLITPTGRLTLSSTVPTANSVSNGTVIYYLPFTAGSSVSSVAGSIPLWDNSKGGWINKTFTSLSLNISSYSGVNLPIDLFAYLQNDGSIAFASYYWSTTTARTSTMALEVKSGLYCHNLSGAAIADTYGTHLGTAYLTGSSGAARVNDTDAQRFLYNAYNQVCKRLARVETVASWTYNSTAWRSMNNSTANRVELINGLNNNILDLSLVARASAIAGTAGQFGIGADTTTGATEAYGVAVTDAVVSSRTNRSVGQGYHYFQALEATTSATAITFFGGSVYGLYGNWWC